MLGVQLAVLDYTRRRLARDLAQELDFDAAHRRDHGTVLAGDIAQELGPPPEGGGNLDQLAGAGAAVERADAMLAVPALDPRVTRLGDDLGDLDRPGAVGGSAIGGRWRWR